MTRYALVKTDDGREWFVDDMVFARLWLERHGWLAVQDFVSRGPVTIRSEERTRHLPGYPARVVSLEPASREVVELMQAEARAREPRG